MTNSCYDILRAINNGTDVRDMTLRVVDYARVSTAGHAQRKSLENQLDTYRNMIVKNKNWTYAGTYSDEAVTGTKAYLRGGFQQMLADAFTGAFDLIVVKNVSRFARNIKECLVYKDKLKSCGVILYFVENNLNSFRTSDDLMFQFMSLGAEMEAKSARDRTKIVFSQGIQQGKVYGNSKILGYTKDRCKLVIDEEEAEIVRLIFELYVHRRMGLRRIAKELVERELTRRDGTQIPARSIHTVLTNPKYKGYYCGGKTEKIDMGEKYVRRYLPASDWVLYPDENIPPIVAENLWDEAAKIRQERFQTYRQEVAAPCNRGIYRYSGKIESGLVPGARYTRTLYRYQGREREAWHCRGCKDPLKPGSIGPTLYTGELDAVLQRLLRIVLGDYKHLIAELLACYCTATESEKGKTHLSALEQEHRKILQKQTKLLELYEDGGLSQKEFSARNQVHNVRLDKISLEIEQKRRSARDTESRLSSPETIREELTETAKELVPGKEAIGCLVETIIVRAESTRKTICVDLLLKETECKAAFVISRTGASEFSCVLCNTGN